MKPLVLAAAALSGVLFSGAVLAGSDCVDAVADWKPRDVLRQQLEQRGWTVQRIKVDDGCYQVRGVDHHGNKFEAKYSPASLRIRKLEINFSSDGDFGTYTDDCRKAKR